MLEGYQVEGNNVYWSIAMAFGNDKWNISRAQNRCWDLPGDVTGNLGQLWKALSPCFLQNSGIYQPNKNQSQ